MTRSSIVVRLVLMVMVAGVLTTGAWGQGTPVPAPVAPEKKPAPKVYDENADAKQQIADALAKARKENRRVLLQWGGNWCGWCIKLHELGRADKDIVRELLYEYVQVPIDIGHWDKHLDLAAKYGADPKAHGVPFLTVLDEDGKPLVQQDSNELEVQGSDHHDPAKVLAFLKKNQAAPVKADDLLAGALARAKAEQKRLYTHFGAPW